MDDELKQDSQKGFSDTLVDIGEAAAAIGIGAAALYRGAGGKRLSKFADKMARRTSIVTRKLDTYDYDSINYKSLHDMWSNADNGIKAQMQKLNAEMSGQDDLYYINIHSPNSLLPSIIQGLNFREMDKAGISSTKHKRDFNREVIQNVNNQIKTSFAKMGLSKVHEQDARAFAESIAYHLDKNGEIKKSKAFDFNEALSKFRNSELGKRDDFDLIASNITKAVQDARKKFSQQKKPKNQDESFFAQTLLNVKKLQQASEKIQNKAIEKGLGDSAASIRDILRTSDFARFDNYISKDAKGNFGSKNPLQVIRDYVDELEKSGKHEEAQQFLDLKIDAAVRVNEAGEVYSFSHIAQKKNDFLDALAGTLPGQILKARDLLRRNAGTNFHELRQGTISPHLAAIEGSKDGRLKNDYWIIHGDVYSKDAEGNFQQVKDMKNMVTYDGRVGGIRRLEKAMSGTNSERARDESSIRYKFDILGNTENTVFEKLYGLIKGRGHSGGIESVYDSIKNGEGDLHERYRHVKNLLDFMEENSYQIKW